MRTLILLTAMTLLGACSEKSAPPAAPGQAAVTAEASGASHASPASPASPAPVASATPAQDAPAQAAPVAQSAAGPKVLSAEGIGAVRFGMTLAQAEQAAGKAALPEPFDPACSMVRFASLPKLRFMVEEGVVTRADAESGVGNATGVAVGDALAQVRERHPDAELSTHKYDKNGHYLTFPSSDGRAAIILEESGGKVTKVRGGLQPAVGYVETCG